jgi:hypothetical protein
MSPPKITVSDYFLRVFPATAGGFLGAGIFLLVFLFLQSPANSNADNEAFSSFAVLFISFCGAASANVFALLFVSLANSDKFSHRKAILSNVLIATILLFLFSIPFLLSAQQPLGVIGIFLIFSATTSSVFSELYRNGYSLGSLYGAFLGGFLLTVLFQSTFDSDPEAALLVMLFLLPITWFLITSAMIIGELIYNAVKTKVE